MAPRPTVIGIFFLFLTVASILLFFRPLSTTLNGLYVNTMGPSASASRSLSTWIADEEARYAVFLQERQKFITLLGPEAEDIDSFPTWFPKNQVLYTLWDFFVPAFQCPHRVERVGTLGDGGKWVCGVDRVAKQDKCVIYSFGINNESSFESALLSRAPSCEIWGYDYSVGNWGPEITSDPNLSKRAHFEPFALGATDKHDEQDKRKIWTLDSLMKLNGHTFIDILKIDIEGDEFESLRPFLTAHTNGDLPVGQLQIEIHTFHGHDDFGYVSRWWAMVEAAGLRPFRSEPNLVWIDIARGSPPGLSEYSFINIRGDHALISGTF